MAQFNVEIFISPRIQEDTIKGTLVSYDIKDLWECNEINKLIWENPYSLRLDFMYTFT